MKLFILIPLLFLAACANTPEKEVIIKYVYTEVVCADFGNIPGIITYPVKWVIGVDPVGNKVLGLRGDQYANLALNGKDTIRYITEQSKAIGYYEKCIVDHNTDVKNEEGEL